MTIVDLTWDCPDFVCFAGSYSVCERSVVGFDQIVFAAFHVMPGRLIGLDWTGFTGARAPARRFAADSYLGADGGRLMVGLGGFQRFDSLAVDGAGNVCVATLVNGSVSIVAPEGGLLRQIPMPDMFCTNICFGGPGLRTAYMTLSGSGQLVALEWDGPGLRLAHEA